MTDEDDAARFTAEAKRRMRRMKMLVASIGVVLLLAYGLLIRLPPVLIDRAAEKGDDCRTKIEQTGLGDPSVCKIEPGFGGVTSAHRARAKAVAWENRYRSTLLAAELAAQRDLDAAARDRALLAAWKLAGSSDDIFVGPETNASILGADAVLIEMARAPRRPDVEVGITPLANAGVRAALTIADLDTVAELVPATTNDDATKQAVLCLLGKGTCAPAPLEGWIQFQGNQPISQGDPVDALPFVHLTRWTLAAMEVAFDPADGERVIAALLAEAGPQLDAGAGGQPKGSKSKPPEMIRSPIADQLLKTAWILQVELARTRWMLGDLDAARAAVTRADEMLKDERLPRPPVYQTAALRVALWPSEQALTWLDAALASATDDSRPLLALNRGLLLAELGRFDDALTGLPAPVAACTDRTCEGLGWLRLALQHQAGKLAAPSAPPPAPKDDDDPSMWCDMLSAVDAQTLVAHALVAGGDAPRDVRWRCGYGLGDGYDLAALPARLYLVGALAGDGDAEPWLALTEVNVPLRLELDARARAASWRGDAAAAKRYTDRRAKIDAAVARAPAWAPALGL